MYTITTDNKRTKYAVIMRPDKEHKKEWIDWRTGCVYDISDHSGEVFKVALTRTRGRKWTATEITTGAYIPTTATLKTADDVLNEIIETKIDALRKVMQSEYYTRMKKLFDSLIQEAAEQTTPETEPTEKETDIKPVIIKNLADLKRHIFPGVKIICTEQLYHPELVGLIRTVCEVNTVAFYSKIDGQPENKWSTCNYGRGMESRYEAAKNYIFDGEVIHVKHPRTGEKYYSFSVLA